MSDQTEQIINIDIDNTPEIHQLEDGEHELRILSAEIRTYTGENGESKMINVRLESIEDEFADDIYHTVWLPKKGDTPKQRARTNKRIIEFCEACGIEPSNELDLQQFIGQTCRAVVATRPRRDTGEPQNYLKSFV